MPDLEGAYVDALGVDRTFELLRVSYTEQQILRTCSLATCSDLTVDGLAMFCRRHKIPAALAIVGGMSKAEAASIDPVARLLKLACA